MHSSTVVQPTRRLQCKAAVVGLLLLAGLSFAHAPQRMLRRVLGDHIMSSKAAAQVGDGGGAAARPVRVLCVHSDSQPTDLGVAGRARTAGGRPPGDGSPGQNFRAQCAHMRSSRAAA
mmetsp:Transcript_42564/g.104658  ORF Transcript_42564/g.104658 Transcript_42564/m.104658 type:complete len:118 (+) Transcript_42564:107-460(+)